MQGRYTEAVKILAEGLKSRRHVLDPAHTGTLATINNLAASYVGLASVQTDAGKQADAEESWQRAVDIFQTVPERRRNPVYWGYLGQSPYRLDQLQKAREALEKGNTLRGDTSPTTNKRS